jgi:hypothetical protein
MGILRLILQYLQNRFQFIGAISKIFVASIGSFVPVTAIPLIAFDLVQHRMYPVRQFMIGILRDQVRIMPVAIQGKFNRGLQCVQLLRFIRHDSLNIMLSTNKNGLGISPQAVLTNFV